MGFGFSANGDRWGFSSASDWLDSVILSFPAPWKVRDLKGKYYGTEIEDARGVTVLSFWLSSGNPSVREKGDMTDEQWREYCCDSHWESEVALSIAQTVVLCRNIVDSSIYYDSEREMAILRHLVIEHGDWDEDIDDEIKCGGPNRRETSSEHDTRDPMAGMSSSYRMRLKQREDRVCKSCGELRTVKPPISERLGEKS